MVTLFYRICIRGSFLHLSIHQEVLGMKKKNWTEILHILDDFLKNSKMEHVKVFFNGLKL